MTKPCQGPNPTSRQPRLRAPAGATDCHAHVFGPPARYPFDPARSYTPPEAPLAAYRRMLDALGIERAVVVQPSVYGTDNRATLDAIHDFGPGCRGVAVVAPDIAETTLIDMHASGVRGIRLNILYRGGIGIEAMARLADRIKALGWHIQLLLDVRTLPELTSRLMALPVAIVFDHMGHMIVDHGIDHPGFKALLDLLRHDHCWVKLSGNYRISAAGPPYADAVPFARALVAANPARLVWGSDWPHPAVEGPMPDDGDLLDALLDYAPDPGLRRAILVDNPAVLYGF